MSTIVAVIAIIAGFAVIGYYIVLLISASMHCCCLCEGRSFRYKRMCAAEYKKDALDKSERPRAERFKRQAEIDVNKNAARVRANHSGQGADAHSPVGVSEATEKKDNEGVLAGVSENKEDEKEAGK